MIEHIIPIAHAAEAVAAETAASPVAVLGLNAKLFIGQIVNFGILLLIFWKWILPAVTKGLQARTERIEKSLNDAERIEKEKAEFEKWRDAEMTKARQEASTIVTTAQTDAVKAKDQILHQTKEDQQKLIDQAKKQIEQEKVQQLQAAKSELADLITNATEKILRTKLDSKKDEALIKESIGSMTSTKY